LSSDNLAQSLLTNDDARCKYLADNLYHITATRPNFNCRIFSSINTSEILWEVFLMPINTETPLQSSGI